MNPRILVAVGDMLGCGYYRCIIPYKALSKQGFDVTLTNMLKPEITQKYDILLLQRQHHDAVIKEIQAFRENVPHGKIIFEFDDNFHAIPASNPSSKIYRPGLPSLRNVETMVKDADLVTVSTPGLQSEYLRFNKNIHICYNAIDKNDVAAALKDVQIKQTNPNEFRLGWAGSGTHADDFKKIVKVVTNVMDEFPHVRFVLMGNHGIHWHANENPFPMRLWNRVELVKGTFPTDHKGNSIPFAFHGNPTLDYYTVLKSIKLDAAIAPLESYTFNRCKSYVKLLEYGIAEIPFVASRFGPYSDYVKNFTWANRESSFGLLAETDKEWKRSLTELITNPDLRNKLAGNNYKNVFENHTMDVKVDQWITALASIGVVPGTEPGHYEEKIANQVPVAYST